MKYFKNQRCDFKHPVVAMGTFDGVHLGHQKLLEKLKEKAKAVNGESVVITYYHHPLETIHKTTFPYLLTEKDKKEELIKKLGIDYVLYLDFNEKMAQMEPEKFLKDIIIDEVKAKELIVGYDTHFGKNRAGEYEFLKKNEARFGYTIEFVEPFKIENMIISSSIIRDFIREGDIIDALKLLGRYYSVAGFVITGHRIGREIGFPTINVQPVNPYPGF
jgi:riboflavin kinase/FMN adenylyltransferase